MNDPISSTGPNRWGRKPTKRADILRTLLKISALVCALIFSLGGYWLAYFQHENFARDVLGARVGDVNLYASMLVDRQGQPLSSADTLDAIRWRLSMSTIIAGQFYPLFNDSERDYLRRIALRIDQAPSHIGVAGRMNSQRIQRIADRTRACLRSDTPERCLQ